MNYLENLNKVYKEKAESGYYDDKPVRGLLKGSFILSICAAEIIGMILLPLIVSYAVLGIADVGIVDVSSIAVDYSEWVVSAYVGAFESIKNLF